MNDLPAQPSLRRLRQFGVRPKRELGQNFLIDSNLLDVIGKAAELAPEDVVLEVGGGLGVLSEYLSARTAHVHVVELDPRLREPLEDALAPFSNATLHMGDAVRMDFAEMRPHITKVVANLPYGVAATVILQSIEQLPQARVWVAMVQREVGERFAAAPRTPAYGLPSVLAQLSCDVRVLRGVSRNVFQPVPNVDSVLLGLRRVAAAPAPELRRIVQQGFAHRRKALAGSLALAGASERPKQEVRDALERIGLAPDARAEQLSPAQWRELGDALVRDGQGTRGTHS
ncbi:MAG: 16S rRNA (adenine(1518)-N(6)/adenine(1519)-N(6))-dimethyltransferase RsmA [Actinomycetota bacterium]|nr:16S rRNA (adenine(1518)-N(6)/adenine(1519)-N(6))-dimethyltransferase RsmA [Actinomycetota bacterium]